jgi:hypothetical protein
MLSSLRTGAGVPLHKPYKDDGAGGWVPQALTKDLKDVSGVVKLLSTAESKEDGILAEVFHENGWISVEAIATDLRARGYEVEVYRDEHEDERIKLVAHPAAGAKRRKKDQMSLLGDVQPMNPLNS